ncbi:MAG: hypothetical protein R2800_07970 [Flavipsychrobacter sp.]
MKNLITYAALVLCISMMLLGCYSQRTATRQLLKVQTYYPSVLSQLCSDLYPPLVFTKDSITYLKGDMEQEVVFVEVDCDSILKARIGKIVEPVKIPCPPSVYRVDTLVLYKERQMVDRAAIHTLQKQLENATVRLVREERENYILLRVTIILGLYTIVRWVLRIWHIKLP